MSAGPEQPTNVLLVMTDQMRWDMIAAHGEHPVRTPHLDRLAATGVSYRRCYTESPVCVPARAAALTGRLPHRTGVLDNDDALPGDARTFATELSGAGYRTIGIGKMHFSPVREPHGLQQLRLSEEIPRSPHEDEYLADLLRSGFDHVQEPHGIRHELYYVPQVSQVPEDLHTTAWTGRQTVEFVREHRSRPWLCWTSFIKPHPPFDPPAPWYRCYDPTASPDPIRSPAERDHLDWHVRAQHRFKWTSPDLPLDLLRTIRAYYYASVSFVDHWIGQILDELERTGQRDRTLVIFTADHGEYLGDHWAFGKRGFHDAAARIPMILSLPGRLPEGEQVWDLAGLVDVAPTILDAAGLDPRDLDCDGASLLARAGSGTWPDERLPFLGVLNSRERGVYCASDDEVKYVYSAGDDREYALPVADSAAESQGIERGSQQWRRAMALGHGLRERLRRDGHREPLDGDRWRRYEPRSLPPPDDGSRQGRGLQYAAWTDAVGICG